MKIDWESWTTEAMETRISHLEDRLVNTGHDTPTGWRIRVHIQNMKDELVRRKEKESN